MVVAPIPYSEFIGTQTNLYTGETFEFTVEHVEQLRALELPQVTPERYLLLVETGDEVLDYRLGACALRHRQDGVLAGGDHSFTRFPGFVAATA